MDPEFVMAAGVVTDVGGPLSHSSIVAREYGIPALLGGGRRDPRITDGELVRVDGDAGTVTLLDEPAAEAAPETGPEPRRRRHVARAVLAGLALALVWWCRRRCARRSGR